jgi:lipoate-protein ligase A
VWIDDHILRRCAEPLALACWVPETPVVVLGSANDPAVELNVAACEAAGVEVLKRYGGGGAVVLHPGCVVVSLGLWVRQWYQNKAYFERANGALIDALAEEWPELRQLRQDGLSDLVWPEGGDRKVAGTSLFRSRNYLLYQASLLVDVGISHIETLLAHPSREPEYRRRRPHREFLCGVGDMVKSAVIPADVVRNVLELRLPKAIERAFAGELVKPESAQFPTLLARAERGSVTPAT